MKPSRKSGGANSRRASVNGCASPTWIICEPLVKALVTAGYEGTKLAQLTDYKQGSDIVKMSSETLQRINELVRHNDKLTDANL